MYEEELEVTSIQLSNVTNENIKEDVRYQIYKEEHSANSIVPIWGENILILSSSDLSFTINEVIPFKYHRGLLGLEYQTNLYINGIKNHFKNNEDISIETTCEDDQNHMVYEINIISKDKNVEKFIGQMLGFEFEFNAKLERITKKIQKLLD